MLEAEDWVVKLLVAAFLGVVIGLTRQYHRRATGLTSYMLVQSVSTANLFCSKDVVGHY